MKKTKFVLSALLLFLLLPGCATLDVFPGGPEAIWFSPGKTASLESATSDIKNLLGSVKFDGCDATNIDIDKHGMRVSISCTETVVSTSTGTAEYYSGNFFENLFGPSETSDSTTEQQVQVQKSRIFSVAFADINDITLGAGNWVYISMKSGKTLVTQADTEYDAKKLANALASLAKLDGAAFTDCFGIGADWLTDDQKSDLNCGDAVVYSRWLQNGSPTFKAGMRRYDVIVSVNSNKITDKASLEKVMSKITCDKAVTVEVLRYIENGERVKPEKLTFKVMPEKK